MKVYQGMVPPCGIDCTGCPNYQREKNPCPGAEEHCKIRRCKGIYVCCTEKRGLTYCHECKTFPCSRFRKFAQSWQKLGQDLVENQEGIKTLGAKAWLASRAKNSK